MIWIAEEHVRFERAGTRWTSRIAVTTPLQEPTGEWGCRISADGVIAIPGPIFGVSRIQALLLALRLLAHQLHRFVANGGRILDLHEDRDARIDLTFDALWPAPAAT